MDFCILLVTFFGFIIFMLFITILGFGVFSIRYLSVVLALYLIFIAYAVEKIENKILQKLILTSLIAGYIILVIFGLVNYPFTTGEFNF